MKNPAVQEIMDRALRAAKFAERHPEHHLAMTHAKLIAEVEMLNARELALRQRLVEVSADHDMRQADMSDRLDDLTSQIEASDARREASGRGLLVKGILVGVIVELSALIAIVLAWRWF